MFHQPGGIKLPSASQADRNIARSSKGHCTAHVVLGDNEGYRVQAESHLELCNLLVLNARLDVEHIKEQALFSWQDNGREKRHFFDALVFLKCGRRLAFTLKPEIGIASGRFPDEMQEITKLALDARFCDEVRLVTDRDIDRIDQRNAMLFVSVRQSDPEADGAAIEITKGMMGSVSLRDLTIRMKMGARGYRALIRMMKNGLLVPAYHEVIRPQTLVNISGEIQ